MGKRGPKKIPTAIKLAEGTLRKDRDGDPETEIRQIPLEQIPDVPQVLEEEGRKRWFELCGHLFECGILEPRYLQNVQICCEAWDRKVRAAEKIAEQGEYITLMTGAVIKHPALLVIKECDDRICRVNAEMGFTPSSSSAVHKQGPKKGGIAARGKTG